MTFQPKTLADIHTPVWPIDTMPALCKSLGKAGVDRIRYNCLDELPEASGRTRITSNPHREFLLEISVNAGGPVDDILAGIARLEYGTPLPLSVTRIHNLLQTLPAFSTELLMVVMSVDKRQAQRYVAALKLCVKHITLHRNRMNGQF